MASYGRILHFVLAGSLALGPFPAQAQFPWGNFVSVSTKVTVDKRAKEERDAIKTEYLRGFASYVAAMVYAQSLDLQERVACLENPATIQSSSTCRAFIYGEDDNSESEYVTLLKAFLEMRRQLALSTTASVKGVRDADFDRFNVPFQFERNEKLSHLFDKYQLDFISSLPAVPKLTALTAGELEPIQQIISLRVRGAAESFYASSGLNDIPEQLEELVEAERAQAQADYERSDRSLEAFKQWDEAQRELDQKVQEHYQEFVNTYRAFNLAGLNYEVNEELRALEESSKLQYYQVIQQFPALAFLSLEDSQIERFLTTGSFQGTFPAVAEAMRSALSVTQSYFTHLQGLQSESLGKLIPLMEMAPLAQAYFDPEIHDAEILEELVKTNQWRELKEDLRVGAIGLAWGFTCGAILAWGYGRLASWGLSAAALLAGRTAVSIQCALSSGLGLNAVFYMNQNHRYQVTFQQFFAVSGEDKGERYQVLREISQLQERDQAMLYESLFLFVGAGIGESARRLLSPRAQVAFLKWLQASGRE